MSPFMETATTTTVNTPTQPHPSQLSQAELPPPSSSLCNNSACISSPDCGAWTVLGALEYWRDSFSVSREKQLRASTTVPFRPATLQMPNFALVETKRITGHLVCLPQSRSLVRFHEGQPGGILRCPTAVGLPYKTALPEKESRQYSKPSNHCGTRY
jgi:hypothetical protein